MRIKLLQAIGWSSATLVLSSCSKAPELPQGVEIVAGRDVEQMLAQCSRDAPEKGESTWRPSASDVRRFEAQLTAKLPRELDGIRWLSPSQRDQLESFPTGFWREYVGIVRQGRRYIYGNFGPLSVFSGESGAVSEGPTDVCDGGPAFFGAEYDASSRSITHLGFNGPFG